MSFESFWILLRFFFCLGEIDFNNKVISLEISFQLGVEIKHGEIGITCRRNNGRKEFQDRRLRCLSLGRSGRRQRYSIYAESSDPER